MERRQREWSYNLVRDTLYSGNETAYQISTVTAAVCGGAGKWLGTRAAKAAEAAAKKVAEEAAGLADETAEAAAKTAAKEAGEVAEEAVKQSTKDALEDAAGETAIENLDGIEGIGKSGSKSGSGSKFQEVFDLADNYTLSDDTFDNHILDRHGPNSTYGNKSHFNADFDIRNGIDSTLTGDKSIVGPNTAGREGYIFEQTFSNPIGTNSKGKPLYTLKVVIDEAGYVITAFPKK